MESPASFACILATAHFLRWFVTAYVRPGKHNSVFIGPFMLVQYE